jgi:hypothetical protein
VKFDQNGPSSNLIRLSGVFIVPMPMSSGEYQTPRRGYLYFRISPGTGQAARKDWNQLKAVAGTGQVVGFALYFGGIDFAPTICCSVPDNLSLTAGCRASTRASLRQRQHVLGLVLAKQPDHAGVSACAALPYRRACPPPRFLPGLRQNSPANCLQSRSFPSLKHCDHNSEKKEALPSIPEIGTPLPCITASGTSVGEQGRRTALQPHCSHASVGSPWKQVNGPAVPETHTTGPFVVDDPLDRGVAAVGKGGWFARVSNELKDVRKV